MSGEPFSEDDLASSPEERRAQIRAAIDRGGAAVCALVAGLCAGAVAVLQLSASEVHRLAPPPLGEAVLAAASARIDPLVLGCAVVLLGGEVARTWAGGRLGASVAARIRRAVAVLLALSAAYVGLVVSPQLAAMRLAAATDLDRIREPLARAALVADVEVVLASALVLLHVLTIATRRPDDDDDAEAPLPPGPFGSRDAG